MVPYTKLGHPPWARTRGESAPGGARDNRAPLRRLDAHGALAGARRSPREHRPFVPRAARLIATGLQRDCNCSTPSRVRERSPSEGGRRPTAQSSAVRCGTSDAGGVVTRPWPHGSRPGRVGHISGEPGRELTFCVRRRPSPARGGQRARASGATGHRIVTGIAGRHRTGLRREEESSRSRRPGPQVGATRFTRLEPRGGSVPGPPASSSISTSAADGLVIGHLGLTVLLSGPGSG